MHFPFRKKVLMPGRCGGSNKGRYFVPAQKMMNDNEESGPFM